MFVSVDMKLARKIAFLGLPSVYAVEQVHIGFGLTPATINVAWVTNSSSVKVAPTVRWGTDPSKLDQSSEGTVVSFKDDGVAHREIFTIRAEISGLDAATRYYYSIDEPDPDSPAEVFSFFNAPAQGSELNGPMKFLVFGDMGFTNSQSLKGLIAEAEAKEFPYGIDVGDFGYNLNTNNGTIGDKYFIQNQPIYAATPFIVCPGNHESAANFTAYTYRWSTNPSNTGALPAEAGVGPAGQPNNWFYSVDIGNVHFVSISTELWFYEQQQELLPSMLKWLQQDLEQANQPQQRAKHPWIIVFGHRSVYCSCDGDCDGASATVRADIELLFNKNGVDLFLNGHEHDYERLYATYNSTYVDGNGPEVNNPRATVYIVSGSAGNQEGHEGFLKPQPAWSAFRSDTYGYSRMTIFNSTHLYWEQVMTDSGEPAQDYGKVIDRMWLKQTHHGAFLGDEHEGRPEREATVSHTTFLSSQS